jgi:hypothetical protein
MVAARPAFDPSRNRPRAAGHDYKLNGLNRRLFEGFCWAGGPLNIYYHQFWNSPCLCLE